MLIASVLLDLDCITQILYLFIYLLDNPSHSSATDERLDFHLPTCYRVSSTNFTVVLTTIFDISTQLAKNFYSTPVAAM